MVWSKISSDVGQCGVKRGWRHLSCYGDSARETALSFCNPWFLNIDSFNLSRETEDTFIFCLQLLLPFFFFYFLVSWKSEGIIFATCLPSYVRLIKCFSQFPGLSWEQTIFSFTWEKTHPENPGSEGKYTNAFCVPRTPGEELGGFIESRWVSRITVSHCYGHQGSYMEKGVELSRQRKGTASCSVGPAGIMGMSDWALWDQLFLKETKK